MGVFIFTTLAKILLFVKNWVSLKIKQIVGSPLISIHNAIIIPEEEGENLLV